MDEDRVVQLLEEIRELQHRQVEAYGRALENQQEALRRQAEATRRGRRLLAGIGVVIAIVLVTVLVLLRYVLQHYS